MKNRPVKKKPLTKKVKSMRTIPQPVGPGGIVAQVMSVTDAEKLLPPRKPSKYQVIFDQLKALKPGQAATFTLPSGVDARAMCDRLPGYLEHAGIKAPEGHSFYKRVGSGGQLIVSVKVSRKRTKAKR